MNRDASRRGARRAAALVALALAACGDDPSQPPADVPPRILGGAPACDGCARLQFDVAGLDADSVIEGELGGGPTPTVPINAAVLLQPVTGDSGRVLRTTVVFTEYVEAGTYWLALTLRAGSGTRRVVVANTLTLTKAYEPPDPLAGFTGSLRIEVRLVAGPAPSYRLPLYYGSDSCAPPYYFDCSSALLDTPGDIRLDAPSPLVVVWLDEIGGCRELPGNPRDVTIPNGGTVDVVLELDCS